MNKNTKYGVISKIDQIIRHYKKGLLFDNTEEEALKLIEEQIRIIKILRCKKWMKNEKILLKD